LIRASYLPGRMGRYVVPPLGALTLAAMLRRERPEDVEFKILDTGLERYSAPEAGRAIAEYAPDVVGISALSLEAVNLHRLAAEAKKINGNIKVVVGGPHATCFYDQVLGDANIDFAVVGEGEHVLIELLDALRDGSVPPHETPGLAQRSDGRIIFGGPRPYVEDLDSLPMPAWDLVDFKRYSPFYSMNTFTARSPHAPIFSSRACPYRCAYCHSIFGKQFRAQSPERTLDEIELLYRKFGVRELQVYDDVFNFNHERVFAICEGILKRGIDIKIAFPNGVRGDIMTRDMIGALARAGAYSITYAVESASPRIQRLIRKNLNLDKVFDVVKWTYDEGIIPCGFFMLGFPTETKEEIEQTIRYASDSRMLRALFFTVVPFPRTELYNLAKETYPNHDFTYDFSPKMYYWAVRPYFSEVTGIDVEAMSHRAWWEFYIRPWRMAQILRRFPKNFSFLRSIYAGLAYGWIGIGRKEESLEISSPAPYSTTYIEQCECGTSDRLKDGPAPDSRSP